MATWLQRAAWSMVAVCWPALVTACPACVSTTEKNRAAYLITTAIMTLMPLFLVGGLIAFIRRAGRAAKLDVSAQPGEPGAGAAACARTDG